MNARDVGLMIIMAQACNRSIVICQRFPCLSSDPFKLRAMFFFHNNSVINYLVDFALICPDVNSMIIR